MSDLISRQTALDALKEYEIVESDNFTRTDPVSMMAVATIANCIEAIWELPPAEPEQEEFEWCHDCKEYDQEKHCCHRWTKVIRQTVEELKAQKQEITAIVEDFGHPCGTYGYCSNCGGYCVNEEPYCPHCGAKVEWR